MKTYKAYCFDLDGTVYLGKEGIQTAIDCIHRLQAKGIEPFYLTNNSSKTQQQLQEILANFGVHAPANHIFSSALATAKYVANYFAGKRVALMGSDGIRVAMLQEGITLCHDAPDVLVMH